MTIRTFILLSAFIITGCTEKTFDDLILEEDRITYTADIPQIMQENCVGCHNSNFSSGGVKLDNYEDVKKSTQSGNLISEIALSMPPPPNQIMSIDLRNKIIVWHANGCPEN